jgi:hypothetical protein
MRTGQRYLLPLHAEYLSGREVEIRTVLTRARGNAHVPRRRVFVRALAGISSFRATAWLDPSDINDAEFLGECECQQRK